MLKRFGPGLLAALVLAAPAYAQGISQKVAVCNPFYTARCVQPDASGNTPVTLPSGASASQVQGTAAAGAVPVGNPVYVGGTDGTNVRALLTGTDGRASANLAQVNGATVNVGVGAAGTGTQRVTTSTDSTIGTVSTVTSVGTVTSVTSLGTLTTLTGGGVASGATDSGNPVKIGGVYNSTYPGLTAGQRGDLQLNSTGHVRTVLALTSASAADAISNVSVLGRFARTTDDTGATYAGILPFLFNGTSWDRQRGDTTGAAMLPYGLAASHWNYAAASGGIVNTATAVTIKTAAGAGVRNCISNLQVAHDTLGGATELALRDGAAGTVLWRGRLQTTAQEGADLNLSAAICGTANTLMEAVTLTAVTGGVYVNAQGYTGP